MTTKRASVKDLIRSVLAIDPSAPAVEDKGSWYNWGEIANRIDALDTLYLQLGIAAGGRIAVFMRNRFEPFAALFSALATDRCLVTINPHYPDTALAADIIELRPPVVVAEPEDWARPAIAAAVRTIGAAGIELADSGPRLIPGMETVTGRGLRVEAPDVVIEILTSGTTGRSKRVGLKKTAFQHSFESALAYEKDRDAGGKAKLRSGVGILHAPLSHIGGLWTAINAVAAGRASALLERFSVQEWHAAVVRHRPRVAGAPPAALRMILEADIPKNDLSSLVALFTGTAPVEPSLTEAYIRRYQIPILTSYGATEFAGAVAGWTITDFRNHYDRKIGSVGRLQRGVEARIVDPDTGKSLPFGEQGILELKSRQLPQPDAWLRTTDRAVLDNERFLWIKGRADNAINRGGFKIHPDDVVRVLETHPAIREAAVVGIAQDRLGEAPAAAMILKAGCAAPSEAELVAFLKERLLPYEVPVQFQVMGDFPRTPSLKPALGELRAMLVNAARPN